MNKRQEVSKLLNSKEINWLSGARVFIGADLNDDDLNYTFQILWKEYDIAIGFYEEPEIVLKKIAKFDKLGNFL